MRFMLANMQGFDPEKDLVNNEEMIVGDRSYFNRLVNALHPSKANTIQSLYDEKDWAVEVEAFHFEDQPEVVNNELKKFVF